MAIVFKIDTKNEIKTIETVVNIDYAIRYRHECCRYTRIKLIHVLLIEVVKITRLLRCQRMETQDTLGRTHLVEIEMTARA